MSDEHTICGFCGEPGCTECAEMECSSDGDMARIMHENGIHPTPWSWGIKKGMVQHQPSQAINKESSE